MPSSSRLAVVFCIMAATTLAACSNLSAPRDTPPGDTVGPAVGRYEIHLGTRRFLPAERRPDWNTLLAAASSGSDRLLVQLFNIPNLDTRVALAVAGVELGQPLTGVAYLAKLRADFDSGAEVLSEIRWADRLPAADKISAAITDPRRSQWARRASGKLDLVITLFSATDFTAVVGRVRELGAEVIGTAPVAGVLTARVAVGQETAIAGINAVRFIEPALPPGSDEGERARAYIGAAVGAIPAGEPDGTGVAVAVAEARHAQVNHPDFGTRVQKADVGTLQSSFHPTFSLGMILGDGTRSLNEGAASANQWRGIAPAANGLSYNYTTSADTITDYIGDITDAVQNDGADVISNSWGDSGCATRPYGSYAGRSPFLDGAVAGNLGRPVAIVFSVGNERDGFGANDSNVSCITNTVTPFINYLNLNHPKSAKNLITVGAVDSVNDAMTHYSSWGPTLDGRLKPEVVAGGQHGGVMANGVSDLTNAFGNPIGTANQQGYRTPILDEDPDPPLFIYGWFTQTSSAAAAVSGGLALMLDAWRREFPGRADPLPSTLKATLTHTAADLDDSTVTWYQPGPDFASGYGRVRIDAAIASIQRGDAIEGSAPHGGSAAYFLNVAPGSGPLRITLAWDDFPAIENANPALINDLDLVVIDPNGVRHFPWTLDPANPAAPAVRTGANTVDNLEQVLVDNPAAGDWTVNVQGTTVASGRQNFSLVTRDGFDRQPADLLMALDTSSSMSSPAGSGLPKIEVLRRSVQLLLDTWNLHALDSDRTGLVAFGDDVSTTPNTVPALQPFKANYAALSSAAMSLSPAGCTALGGALQVAFDSFNPASNAKRAILVVTDGMHSTNPFVGEAGNPSRLRLGDYASPASPPFDGFYCNSGTANGPGGNPIATDGMDISDHNAEIFAIGIGVNGAGFQQLVERLASENDGVHHLTTTPDSDLDSLYINDLVRALKSNTLEIIVGDSGTVAVGAHKDYRFPANATLRSVTVVLSWQGSLGKNAIEAQVVDGNGALLTPNQIIQQAFSTVMRFDLAAAEPGTWRVRLTRDIGSSADYQLSIIGDETCLHYDLEPTRSPLRAGEPLSVALGISAAGRALSKPLDVRARISSPLIDTGRMLAEKVPKTKAARAYLKLLRARAWQKLPAAGGVLEAAIAELNRSGKLAVEKTEWISMPLKPRKSKHVDPALLGETRYESSSFNLGTAGPYQVVVQLEGASACGPVRRRELTGWVVGFGKPDREKTRIERVPGSKGTVALIILPVDESGNVLGPGNARQVSLEIDGLTPVTAIIDRLDGSYLRVFEGARSNAGMLRAKVSGHGWRLSKF